MATMGDLISFQGYENTSTPFLLTEHVAEWRNPQRRYLDFKIGNDYNATCHYPRFWLDSGFRVGEDVTSQMNVCLNSEFDQYGDTEAFGVYPDWRRQLSKFASAQDRLREWNPTVREKISHFSCLTIKMLDIDGFRLDKATQITVDALGDFAESMRDCAREVGKENFFIPGEITGGNTFGSIYLGRGRQPDMLPPNLTAAVMLTNASNSSLFIRDIGKNALDSAAFHYSVYRSMLRFLGMDGSLTASFDTQVDWVDGWNEMLTTNDYINPSTNQFDPRHMYGVSNQDVFRWPSIANGTDKWLLGNFITTLLLPGIPLLLWGEEQAFYVLDNTAKNYVFGRQAMSASLAWQVHGCYKAGSAQYYDWDTIVGDATYGCEDDWNSLDHRDPAHPIRNTIKAMYQMRQNYPVLNDGMFLQGLSRQTQNYFLPGSSGVATEMGIWSRFRGQFSPVQNFTNAGGQGDQSIWLVYTNNNITVNYQFNCSDPTGNNSLVAPYPAGTVVRNLFFPYEEYNLTTSNVKLGLEGSPDFNGCLHNFTLPAWGFKAFVRKTAFVQNGPMITKFLPGHDFRVVSTVAADKPEVVPIEFHYSSEMDCKSVSSSISLTSKTESNQQAQLDNSTVKCSTVPLELLNAFQGSIPTLWTFKANLTNVYNGIHSITVNNATNINGTATDSRDTFLLRVGQLDNPVVFPRLANYTLELLHQRDNGSLYVSHKAAGADFWRYTLDWTHYSDWMPYTGGNSSLAPLVWSGTSAQEWDGHHVILQYHNKLSGSSDYYQHSDLDDTQTVRRFPHLFAEGPFNQYGYDAGLANKFRLDSAGLWKYDFATEWPAVMQINVWGVNPDKQPDLTFVYGDADGDSVLDRSPPSALAATVVNITEAPGHPHFAWEVVVHDSTLRFEVVGIGHQSTQIAIYVISWIAPVITSLIAVWAYVRFFYKVKINRVGIKYKVAGIWQMASKFRAPGSKQQNELESGSSSMVVGGMLSQNVSTNALVGEAGKEKRQTLLIATIEYDIEDWNIKIKIGGLGVMVRYILRYRYENRLTIIRLNLWVKHLVSRMSFGSFPAPAASHTQSIHPPNLCTSQFWANPIKLQCNITSFAISPMFFSTRRCSAARQKLSHIQHAWMTFIQLCSTAAGTNVLHRLSRDFLSICIISTTTMELLHRYIYFLRPFRSVYHCTTPNFRVSGPFETTGNLRKSADCTIFQRRS
jgi:alpha-1,3-glucan synthase